MQDPKDATDDTSEIDTKNHNLIYGIDDIPPPLEALTLGFQHYLTMFGSTIAIPFIMAGPLGIQDDPVKLTQLISTMFLVSGICTLLQSTWGNRLPIIQGGTFSFLTPAITICGMAALKDSGFETKMHHIQGAIIVGACVQIAFGYLGLVGRMLRFVGPITIAPTIALIGLSLYPFGASKAGEDWAIGGLTIFLIILFSQILRKTHRMFELFPVMLAILIAWGMAAIGTASGYIAAGSASFVDFSKLDAAPWFSMPYPFQWADAQGERWPVFAVPAIVGMLAGVIASMVESIGDYYAAARLSGAPVPTPKIINRGIGMEGIGCFIAGCFGTGNGTTSYSENIGAIGLTRVGSRRVVQMGAFVMMVLAIVGKFGGLFTTIPGPIVGGMYCAMFGMIASVGLSNLQFVDLNSSRNLFIVGFSFFMGLSIPHYFSSAPLDWFFSGCASHYAAIDNSFAEQVITAARDVINTLGKTGMAVGAFIALVLDNVIPGTDEERGLNAWSAGH
ncbi:MAG: xanthine permease [Deltaproteobacteria bacterium]|nr:xanthine permease [Deltaproteobacteria bacterium]